MDIADCNGDHVEEDLLGPFAAGNGRCRSRDGDVAGSLQGMSFLL